MKPRINKNNHVYAKTVKEARERGYWFKAKEYGYGWVPVTWQGWIVTIAYMALVVRDVITIVGVTSEGDFVYAGDGLCAILMFTVVPFFLYSVIFYFLTVAKGEPAKWRWGDKE